jgi:hypothetical protein
VREAQALGLDRDDTIIRRRLRQKLEFVSEDLVSSLAEPTDAELGRYLEAHADAFRGEPRVSFTQVYLDPARRPRVALDAEEALAALRAAGPGADGSAFGDATQLGDRFDGIPGSEVAKVFGDRFAKALDGLAPGQWHGPVPSGYGLHLVLVRARAPGGVPALTEIRDVVRRERASSRRRELKEEFYQALLRRYAVTIEAPGAPAEAKTAARPRP